MSPIAVTSFVYGPTLLSLWNKEIDYDTDVIKAMLCTDSYIPSQDTHRYKSSVTNEVVGTGYTATGVTLTSKTIAYDGATNTLTLDCADLSWPGATITARYVVFYDASPATDATRPLISCVDLGTNVSTVASTWSYVIPSTGIAQNIAA